MQRSSSGASIVGLSSPCSSALMDAGRGLIEASTGSAGGAGTLSSIPLDGRAANFVPKLLAKLTALEDKVNRIMETKVDTARYLADEDRRMADQEGMMDELRHLKESSEELQHFAAETRAVLRNKADLAAQERALRHLQDLQATVAQKVDLEAFRTLQESMLIAESNIEGLQNSMNLKADTSVTDAHERQLEAFAEALMQKTDMEQFMQLQSELCATESSLEALTTRVGEKADLQEQERMARKLQELGNNLHGKTDLVTFNSMERSFQKVQSIAHEADSFMRTGVQVSDFRQMKEDMTTLFNVLDEKAGVSELQQLENELNSTGERVHYVENDLEVRRKEEAEMKSKVQTLSVKAQHLEDLSHILVTTKADATCVPHLHESVLQEFPED